ncbi:MAG: nicotinate phosphoribosyltransferase, partial [Ruthenibacterium sp.]
MTDINAARNLTLLMDFYELTMAGGYFEEGYTDKVGVFDMFFRRIPDDGGFAIAAGLAQFCEIIDDLHFDEDDIDYLRGKNCFSEGFLDYLRHFTFHCNIWSVPEGTPIFPQEPIVIVEGPAIEAQLIETLLLVT